ncbi:hypothetical protein N7530_006940 [Penicillium desertorum]|uniref:Uncharacterized protein n=1 Tax=Penicillium desertorum TaxID=1303715 RepID=A0A9W9WSP2_9EURO|nr:hypothetical protein N7530_006940 [Penicillium desertorum]
MAEISARIPRRKNPYGLHVDVTEPAFEEEPKEPTNSSQDPTAGGRTRSFHSAIGADGLFSGGPLFTSLVDVALVMLVNVAVLAGELDVVKCSFSMFGNGVVGLFFVFGLRGSEQSVGGFVVALDGVESRTQDSFGDVVRAIVHPVSEVRQFSVVFIARTEDVEVRPNSMWPSGNMHMCTTDNAINVKEANALGPGAIVLQAACEGSTTLERDNLDPHAALTIATCVMAVNFLSGRLCPHILIVHCQSWPDKVVGAVCIGSFSTTAVLSHWTRTAESNRIVFQVFELAPSPAALDDDPILRE